MIRFETAKPPADGPKAAVYAFAKKHRLSDEEAERLFLKLGASASQEAMLAEARMPASDLKKTSDKNAKS